MPSPLKSAFVCALSDAGPAIDRMAMESGIAVPERENVLMYTVLSAQLSCMGCGQVFSLRWRRELRLALANRGATEFCGGVVLTASGGVPDRQASAAGVAFRAQAFRRRDAPVRVRLFFPFSPE